MADHAPNPADPHGTLLSEHPHPRPLQRRITALLLAVGLAGSVFGIMGLIVIGFAFGLYLLPLMAVFLLILTLPLIQLAVMHPQIVVYEHGLSVTPLLWRTSWITWDAITRVENHTLIRRIETKSGQLERDGRLIIVASGLPWPYQIIGGMAGHGWRTRAFGIATHAHRDYPAILNTIQHYKVRQ